MLVQFTPTALGFFGTDESLQGSFAFGNPSFQAVDVGFEFVDALFHLLALDGIQALGLSTGALLVSVGGRRFTGERNGFLQGFSASLLPPQIILIIAGVDFDLAVANVKNSGGELVDEVAIVRNEDYRSGVVRQCC